MDPSENEKLSTQRIQMLEGLLAQTDEERHAELVYSASVEFLRLINEKRTAGPGHIPDGDASDALQDPANYGIRIRNEEHVLFVLFLPRLENIRGGGWEIGVNRESGAVVSTTPMM
jgi:hypothetical protein